MHTALTLHSRNDKTGSIAVSTTARPSCSPTCPLAGDGGCYADANYRTRDHWDRVTAGTRGLPNAEFTEAVSNIRPGRRFRHNVAGDLWHDAGRINGALLRRLADAASHLTAWTYTHHARTVANLATIRSALRRGFTVNLSTESKLEAAYYARRGYPVVCVVPEDAPPHFVDGGVKFRQCPATFDGSPTQCATCGGGVPLCARADRDFVITFPAHGARSARAAAFCS